MDSHILIIPIFVPHLGCPHQCIFCNQHRISGTSGTTMTTDLLEKTVELHIKTRRPKGRSKTQIAFYGGSFTGLDRRVQESLLAKACDFIRSGDVDSIRISTRPDSIDHDIIRFLNDHMVGTIELGVQSMADEVLIRSNRGHTASHVERAVAMIQDHKCEIGLQIMPGLPGDTTDRIKYTVRKIVEMKPDFVRIYPTLVIKDTPLEVLYLSGDFVPMTLDEAVNICREALLILENAHIPVVRLGLQPTPELNREGTVVAGPYHPAFRHLVESTVFLNMSEALIEQALPNNGKLTFKVNSRDYSYFCGQKNMNLLRLKEKYGLHEISIVSETGVDRGGLELMIGSLSYCCERRDVLKGKYGRM